MIFSTVFDRFPAPRSIEASASVDSASKKTTFDFCTEMYGAPAKKLFGPRKPRCVDFIRQTYGKRYDFFDISSTAIDRGVEVATRGRGCQMGWGWLGWLAGRFIVIFIFIKDDYA